MKTIPFIVFSITMVFVFGLLMIPTLIKICYWISDKIKIKKEFLKTKKYGKNKENRS